MSQEIRKIKNKTTVVEILKTMKKTYRVDEKGYYGTFGGAYIPEMLYPNVEELRQKYLEIMYEDSFQEEFKQLLKDYVGRPSPLFYAERLSEKYNTKIYQAYRTSKILNGCSSSKS